MIRNCATIPPKFRRRWDLFDHRELSKVDVRFTTSHGRPADVGEVVETAELQQFNGRYATYVPSTYQTDGARRTPGRKFDEIDTRRLYAVAPFFCSR